MARIPTNDNKERICVFIDKRTLAHFRHVADMDEIPYSILINKALREYVEALPPEQQYHNR